jgi:hypothetical protein
MACVPFIPRSRSLCVVRASACVLAVGQLLALFVPGPLRAEEVRTKDSPVALSARLWERAGQAGVPAAIELYRELRRRDPEGFRALPWDQELNRFGYRLDSLGRYAEAIEVFRLNVENTPEHWGPHDSLAEACMHAGQRDRSIEHYRRSVELNPKNQEGARFLFLLENYEKQTLRIPMRDGVKLFTQIYAPRDRTKKHPVMLYRTPYGNPPYNPSTMRSGFGIAWKMAEEGTIFVFQDVRGTRLSEGAFVPMRPLRDPGESGGIDESTDAWDTIEWLLKNVPHQNGRVGMRGNSYAGLYALMGALSRHPALVAVSPQAPPIDWFRGDDMHTNGALNLLMAVNWLRTNGVVREGPDEKEVPPVLDLGCPDLFTFFRQAGPLSTWNARYFKDRVPFWNDLMTHTTYDAFWKARNFLPHLTNLSAAVLMVGGWFDAEDPYGPVAAYSEIERRQPGNSSTLVMGPWYHGGWTRSDGERLGDVDVDSSEAARFFRLEVELAFFDHHLRGAKSPGLPEALVFDTGTATWRSLAAWPPVDVLPTAYYFRGNGLLDTDAPTGEAAFDEFPSDPARPVPFSPWIEREWSYRFMTADQRFAASRPDVLTFATEPLPEDVTAVGPVGAELFVSTTGTDADWVVKVVDVYPTTRLTIGHAGENRWAATRRSYARASCAAGSGAAWKRRSPSFRGGSSASPSTCRMSVTRSGRATGSWSRSRAARFPSTTSIPSASWTFRPPGSGISRRLFIGSTGGRASIPSSVFNACGRRSRERRTRESRSPSGSRSWNRDDASHVRDGRGAHIPRNSGFPRPASWHGTGVGPTGASK